ncbi:MAG: iron-sulfur cluster assembly scaffold protein [Alphaproteobacteria bacterium]|jgi:nitrogen fixation NifU-like protein|nr:iron-sulfur cluster assembly scaffold protein [Alphaproteobacteria bacterium]MDP6515237.1 iron-sulfur cluster assembly scaffold protein [Alphaproteobacteria bacterium]
MTDDDLYQQAIMTLARAEVGAGGLAEADVSATIDNPLCGDRVRIDLAVTGDVVVALAHKVRGCALCRASASVIGARAVGESEARLRAITVQVESMLREAGPAPAGAWSDLGAFHPVAAHRSRHDCVLLPFRALLEALGNRRED